MSFKENLTLLYEKSPHIAFLAHTSPRKKRKKRGKVDFNTSADLLYICGLDDSYPYLKRWLSEKEIRKLVYLEGDPGKVVDFLHSPLAHFLLQDPQVYLIFSSKKTKCVAEELANRFPTKNLDVVGPKRFRWEILRATLLISGLLTDRLFSYVPFQNFIHNLRKLPSSFLVNNLKGLFRGLPAIIVGAGPTLAESIPVLRQAVSKALVIAGGSGFPALTSQGVFPHLAVMVDPNQEEVERAKIAKAPHVPLIYNMRTHPDVVDVFQGPIGYIRSTICALHDLWMEEELGITKEVIGKALKKETLSVTPLCLELAHYLGCSPIVLVGVDLAYTYGKRYAGGVVEKESPIESGVKMGNLITTLPWLLEKNVLSSLARKRKIINASKNGLSIFRIPYLPLREVLSQAPLIDIGSFLQRKMLNKLSITKEAIENLIEKLQVSIQRCYDKVLLLEKGENPLAEMELQEEPAMKILFYDTKKLVKSWASFRAFLEEYLKGSPYAIHGPCKARCTSIKGP